MSNERDDLRPEYPGELIRSGVRGKYAARYRQGTNLVLIEPDLREHFPDSASVNRALREHLEERRKGRVDPPLQPTGSAGG
jgi:hypothetical protein